MYFLVSKGLPYVDGLKTVFELDSGEKDFLGRHLMYLIKTKRKYKEAASVAVKLKMQDFFKVEDILLPLVASDKLQVAENFVADSQFQQKAYANLLDNLCAMSEEQLESFAR